MDKKPTRKQLELLLLLYKFRFLTVELLTQITDVDSANSIRERLAMLVKQGWVGRRYGKSYRKDNRHAEYYLLNDGIAALREVPNCDPKTLHNLYKDKTAAPSTIAQRLAIARTYSLFRGEQVRFLTQSQLASFKGLPNPPPNALLSVKTGKGSRYFFVEVLLASEPYFVALHRRIKRYIEYAESGDWEIEQKNVALPTVLVICDTPALQKRLTKRMSKLIEASWNDDLKLYSASLEVIAKQGQEGKIWQPMDSTEGLVSFKQLLNI